MPTLLYPALRLAHDEVRHIVGNKIEEDNILIQKKGNTRGPHQRREYPQISQMNRP